MCIIKHVTTIPCPSCGSTRSVLSILNGEFIQALHWNPIGYILVMIMAFTPAWTIFDFLTRKSTFYEFYLKAETVIRQKKFAIPAILLVLVNWFWNIYKGL